MPKFKMLSTQKGVKAGEVHASVFHEGRVYEIDDDLAGQFGTLDAIEGSDSDEVAEAVNEEGREDLHENWLDTDPAVMRHGELTPEEIVRKDESPPTDGVKADGGDSEAEEGDEDESDEKPEGEKKARKARKSAPENK